MTEEDKKILADAIADELLEVAEHDIDTEEDRGRAALLVVDRIEQALHQMGWRPPEMYDRIVHWTGQTARLPEHHINQSVLTSQLAELTQILHDC